MKTPLSLLLVLLAGCANIATRTSPVAYRDPPRPYLAESSDRLAELLDLPAEERPALPEPMPRFSLPPAPVYEPEGWRQVDPQRELGMPSPFDRYP